MLATVKAAIGVGAIALGFIVVNFSTLPTNAQTNNSENFNFENIGVGEDSNWNFTSESETISVQDDIKELGDYSIDDSNDSDVRLIEEERRWGNKTNLPNYTLEAPIYDY